MTGDLPTRMQVRSRANGWREREGGAPSGMEESPDEPGRPPTGMLSRAVLCCLEATMGFEPMTRRLQHQSQATFGTLAHLWPDSVEGSASFALPGGPRPLTVFWGQATDNNRMGKG